MYHGVYRYQWNPRLVVSVSVERVAIIHSSDAAVAPTSTTPVSTNGFDITTVRHAKSVAITMMAYVALTPTLS